MSSSAQAAPHLVSVVIPIRCDAACGGHEDLARSLRALCSAGFDVAVADGSAADIRRRHERAFAGSRQLPVLQNEGANGKVAGVHAGVSAALHERVVLADDDVLYEVSSLLEVASLLDQAELVVPQNYFVGPGRWHTTWDTARSLVNRAVGHDYPGTVALRRSAFLQIGGYRGDVLFENLELVRTIRAAGGRVRWAPDVFVPRLAPSAAAFANQRVRQAYDDFAQIPRLIVEAAILPVSLRLARRRPTLMASLGIATIGIAELGRRRRGGRTRFPVAASLAAPLWLLERGVCVWLAIGLRLFRGGIRYRGVRIRTAASSPRHLRSPMPRATDSPVDARSTAPDGGKCDPAPRIRADRWRETTPQTPRR